MSISVPWLVLLVPLAACSGAGDPIGDILALDGDPVAGAAVFDADCAVCHGADGTGGVGSNLVSRTNSEEEVISAVYDGQDGMPSFSDSLSDQDIADVTAYVTQDLQGG